MAARTSSGSLVIAGLRALDAWTSSPLLVSRSQKVKRLLLDMLFVDGKR